MRVEIFSVARWYSSSPSLRCAFCIGLSFRFRWRLRQLQGSTVGIDQPEFIGPSFPMVNNLGVAVIFDEGRYVFDRSPAGDMPFVAFAEHPIQETGSAQQSDMASVQRS